MLKEPIEVNWPKLCTTLEIDGFSESITPEAIVHELLHGYECIGKKVFTTKLGDQRSVYNLIEKHFVNNRATDSSEIRVSAATVLVLQSLGHLDVLEIVRSACINLRDPYTRQQASHRIMDAMFTQRVQRMAKSVHKFITTQFNIV